MSRGRRALLEVALAACLVADALVLVAPDSQRALAADAMSADPVESAEWLLRAIRQEAAFSGVPLTIEELRMLRTPIPQLFGRNVDRELFQALNDKVVRLARSAMERAKAGGALTVIARPGLRIPVDWFQHYTVIFTGDLDWVLSGVLQNAMIGNPGETTPWESR